MGAYQAFEDFALEQGVAGFFPEGRVLKSKRISHWYVNWRTVVEDAWSLDMLATFILDFAKGQGLQPDCFYGVPEGASKLGIVTQMRFARGSADYGKGSHVVPMGRGAEKDHGDPRDKYFVGAPRGKTIVIEDVTTTGGSLLRTIRNVKELKGVEVIAALGLTNRMELTPIQGVDDKEVGEKFAAVFKRATGREYTAAMGVEAAVTAAGVPYFALSTAADLLPRVFAQKQPGSAIAESIEKEFATYGLITMKLGGA